MMSEDIRRALRDGPLTVDQILDALGARGKKATSSAIKHRTCQLVRRGWVAVTDDGR